MRWTAIESSFISPEAQLVLQDAQAMSAFSSPARFSAHSEPGAPDEPIAPEWSPADAPAYNPEPEPAGDPQPEEPSSAPSTPSARKISPPFDF